jgi:organic radical activating enzyme
VAIETNGTVDALEGIDWVCVSPKSTAPLAIERGHELKLVFPTGGRATGALRATRLSTTSSSSRWMARSAWRTRAPAIDYCLAHPRWRLSLQSHKIVGIR